MENRKLSARHGWTRYSRHALATVASEMPRCRASSRVDQCVTAYFFGGGVSVAVTIRRWSMVRGRPERGSSSSPANPRAAYRSRHPITVGRDTPNLTAIAVFDTPSAANNTIRARCASPARIDDERVHRVSSSRSPSRSPNAGAGRFATPHDPNHPTVNQLNTRGTR